MSRLLFNSTSSRVKEFSQKTGVTMTFLDMLGIYLVGYFVIKYLAERSYSKDKQRQYEDETRIARMLGILEE